MSTRTQPDIMFSVNILSPFLEFPQHVLRSVANRVLKKLVRTPRHGVMIRDVYAEKDGQARTISWLSAFSDSD